mgnify:CR=1 FL=1
MPFNTRFWDELVIQSYKTILRRKPESALIHTNLGLAYVRVNKDKKAVRSFQRALKYNKKYAEAYYHLGMTYKRLGKIEEALRCFNNYNKLTVKKNTHDPFVDEVVAKLKGEDQES